MFTQRLEELFQVMKVKNNTEFARTADFDRTYISRVRSGNRTPAYGSRAAKKIAQSVLRYAQETGMLMTVREYLGCQQDLSIEETAGEVERWLYDGQESVNPERPARQTERKRKNRTVSGHFGKRLRKAMEFAELSNAQLAHFTNVDASLISRYRNGQRVPHAGQDIMEPICQVLYRRIITQDRIPDIVDIIGAPAELFEDYEMGLICFRNWMCVSDTEDSELVERFLVGLDSVLPNMGQLIPETDRPETEQLPEYCREYNGQAGLQEAVITFLRTVLAKGVREIWLYSDQSTEWMTKDAVFTRQWFSLMSACVRAGVKIRIIHNIDRGLEEMLSAIRNWLPLYLSGMIEGWCSSKINGSRFSHTLFLAPGCACISGFCAGGDEKNARYGYHTEEGELASDRQLFEGLLASSKQLIQVWTVKDVDIFWKEELEKKNVRTIFPPVFSENGERPDYYRILLTDREVKILCLSSPAIVFTIAHPLMRAAFQAYADKLDRESR